MPTKEQIANLIGVLATASIAAAGWTIGSGEFAGFIASVGSGLTSTMIRQYSLKLKTRWLSSNSGILNHDIQNALTRAFIKALRDLQDKYFETGEAHALPENDQETIRQLFYDLKEQAQDVFVPSLKRAAKGQVVKEYLLATEAEATDKLWKQIHGENLLSTYLPDFKNFLRCHLLNAVQEQFNEELKTDNGAWIAFQRLLLEEILARQALDSQKWKEVHDKLDQLRTTIIDQLVFEKPGSIPTKEHHDPAAGINATPATVRIYTLGPHSTYYRLSWTTEYAKAKERWDAFWQSHSVGQAGIATNPADYLTRYRELYPYCSIGSQASGESQQLETTPLIPEVTSERPPDSITGLAGLPYRVKHNIDYDNRPSGLFEALRGVNTTNFEGFDEQGVGFKDIRQDQLSDYCPPIPQIRNF